MLHAAIKASATMNPNINQHKTSPVVIQEDECESVGWDDSLNGNVHWRTLLSADRTSSHTMTCGVTEIGPGHPDKILLHSHAQVEVYYFLSGTGVVHIDGEEYAAKAGTTVFIPGNARHGVRNTGEDALRLFYVFAVDSFSDVKYVFQE